MQYLYNEEYSKKLDVIILKELYQVHPDGLGYNQLLLKARVNKKVLDLRLAEKARPRSLVYRKLVKVSKGRTKKSRWKICITESGRREYIRNIYGKIEDAFKLITSLSEEKMCETLQKIMYKLFKDLFNVKRNTSNLKKLDLFLKTLEEPYMSVANAPLHHNKRKVKGPYYLARFTLERLPLLWINEDAQLAIKMKHWISPGRIRLLTILSIHDNLFLMRHNRKWLNNLRRMNKDPDDQKEASGSIRNS